MIDSPIKRVGGKCKLRAEVIRRLPSDAECFVEVFCGAAWVLFGMRPHPVEVLNDKDGDLINLWRILKWRPAALLEEIQKHLYSRALFYELREPTEEKCELARAVRTYLLIQMAFGSDLSSIRRPRFGHWKKPCGDLFLCKSLEQIFPAAARLRNVFVECLDFEEVIHRYDQPGTIFYCDPPYLDTYGYAEAFTESDHCRLRAALAKIEGRFLLTVNDHPAIRKMYEGCHLEGAKEARALARAQEGRQAAPILYVSNYAPHGASLFEEGLA